MFRGLHPRTDVRLYGGLTNPFIYAICPLTPRIFRDSYGARLRTDNIGFSPPPGTPPAAIALMTEVSLFPRICHCRHRLLPGFRCLRFIARFLMEGLGALTSTARGAGFSHMSDIQFSRCKGPLKW